MSQRQPRVSIGMPVYNGERFLAQAIESLLGQTFADFELVICDNASTDGTEAICRRFAAADGRVRYDRSETNLGAAPNFNKALALATGPYFKWAAHDDVYAPTYLERCAAVLDADPSVVLCHSQTIVIDEAGQPVAPPTSPMASRNGHAERDVAGHHDAGHGVNGNGNGHAPVPPTDVRWEDLYEMPRRLDSPRPQERFSRILLNTRRCFEIFGLMRTDAAVGTGGHGNFYGSDKVILSSLALVGRLVEVPEPLFFRRHHAQTSGSIRSASAREAWMNTSRNARSRFPRVSCLRGYCRSVVGAHLGWRERTGCFAAVIRYIVQRDRWAAVLREPW